MISNKIQRYSYDIFNKSHKIFIEGHRGVNREFFENTIESFIQAIKYNLDSIEIDVWLTKDKKPIVIHGGRKGNLGRYFKDFNYKNSKDVTLNQLLEFELKVSKTKVPTLKEVLDLCKNKIFVNIELKDSRIKKTFKRVIKLIEERKMMNQIAINSYHHKYYELVKKYNNSHKEKIEYGINFEYSEKPFFKRFSINISNICINLYYKEINKELVDLVHQSNNAIRAWFKMDEKEDENIYKYLFDCGIDVICCNEPNKAKQYRDNLYYNKK